MHRYLTFISVALSGISLAGPLYTGPFGPDGTWNLYQLVEKSVTWEEARKQAEALAAPAGNAEAKGHLVTFSSAAENQFVRLLNREEAWCGLTDDERFGGHEAGVHPRNGWKWCNGEPLAYTNWRQNQPDEYKGEGSGEDAVLFDSYGRWMDNGTGRAGQKSVSLYYAVEWETHSSTPVAGATSLEKLWPAKSVMPEWIPGKWNARWVFGYVKWPSHWIEPPRTLPDGLPLLMAPPEAAAARTKPLVQLEGASTGSLPWLWLSTHGGNRQGWLPSANGEANFPTLPQLDSHIGAVVGKIHVDHAGPYTFAISAQDAFALRIGGLKWKSATGDGFIDPLDPLTVTQPSGTLDTKALAVMDLPAGDHLVEALWMIEATGSEFVVLSAPGVHVTEGSTTDWRPLGHRMSSEKVPSLGITDAGWKVECSAASDKSVGLQDGLIKLELDVGHATQTGVSAINFADAPETNPAHFPNASVFPNNPPVDHWPLRATAKMVVPQDGIYEIGLYAAGLGALHIKGGSLTRASQSPQGTMGLHLHRDAFDFDGQANANSEPKIFTEWDLKKGEYDIEVFYVKNLGPASLAVYSCPEGPFAPGLLRTESAGLTNDLPGLPHSSRP